MISRVYKTWTLKQYKYVVILSTYCGKIMLSRHRERTTWETQGGHVEPGETPLEARSASSTKNQERQTMRLRRFVITGQAMK